VFHFYHPCTKKTRMSGIRAFLALSVLPHGSYHLVIDLSSSVLPLPHEFFIQRLSALQASHCPSLIKKFMQHHLTLLTINQFNDNNLQKSHVSTQCPTLLSFVHFSLHTAHHTLHCLFSFLCIAYLHKGLFVNLVLCFVGI
jgi:hypothetical protein